MYQKCRVPVRTGQIEPSQVTVCMYVCIILSTAGERRSSIKNPYRHEAYSN
jgi:hypothetical protein